MRDKKIEITVTYAQLALLVFVLVPAFVFVAVFFARAAFIEPDFSPSASNQDFAQNILGANNADNSFDSSAVTANSDGSIIEVLEHYTDERLAPRAVVINDIDYFLQKNQIWDDNKGDASSTENSLSYAYANSVDQNKEEAIWSTYTDSSLGTETIASGVVYKDELSGLYWSDCYSAAQDGTCDVISNEFVLDGVVDSETGLDAEGGNAINFCKNLSLDADGDGVDETDWYLPSQKELMQAYINGISNSGFNSSGSSWSSTERYLSTSAAILFQLYRGATTYDAKNISSYYANCVRR